MANLINKTHRLTKSCKSDVHSIIIGLKGAGRRNTGGRCARQLGENNLSRICPETADRSYLWERSLRARIRSERITVASSILSEFSADSFTTERVGPASRKIDQ